ncbi:MAG: WbqC family protein [Bacteroidales bacterium]|nr:WbqC family protein [Bacteroidales bacterium]
MNAPASCGDPLFGTVILTAAYLPPVEYFFAVANAGRVLIEQHENYQKQSWRSRCRIYSAGGPEDLTIPVVREERLSRPVRDIRIDYGEPWLQHHIRAFQAAYRSSAFYDYYADDLIPILESRPAFLFDLDMALLEKLLALLGLDVPVSLTDSFVGDYGTRAEDFRGRIQPKYKGKSLLAEYDREKAYYQVFVNRDPSSFAEGDRTSPVPFIPNLSIIDLLSAEGPDAASFLR